MKVIKYPAKEEWGEIVKRPHLDVSQLNATVEGVLNDVKNKDGNSPKYDKQYWEMVKVLEDFANDVRCFQKQRDVEEDVVRVCENLWEISVGCANCI